MEVLNFASTSGQAQVENGTISRVMLTPLPSLAEIGGQPQNVQLSQRLPQRLQLPQRPQRSWRKQNASLDSIPKKNSDLTQLFGMEITLEIPIELQ